MEQQQDGTGVSRSANQLHVLPEDPAAAAAILKPLLDRIDHESSAPQMLVVTSDADAAAAIAARLAASAPRTRITAATEARRAARTLKAGPSQLIAGAPEVFAELLRGSVIKLDQVKVVALGWLDAADPRIAPVLEALMAEVPKEAARFVLASHMTPDTEQLVERYAWRARRVQSAAVESLPPVSLAYVMTSGPGRLDALRRTLDTLDPASAFVVVRDADARGAVEAQLRALGYGAGADHVRVGETPEGAAELIVLYDLPTRDEDLRKLVKDHGAARLVALIAPRQLGALRSLAGGSVTPLTLPDAAVRARGREDRLRDELRAVLEGGQFSRELLAIEPLLTDHDAAEVAAAALRLLEAERGKARTPQMQAAPAAITRLYLNVGSMDDVKPGDLVGAITNVGGISKNELGRVEVRERHSTVEVAASVANAVVGKLTGVEIRGRRVIARIDEDRPRERPRRSGGDRGERRGPPRGAGRDRPPRPRRERS